MAEPPAKRARRTDSSAMWDANDGNHKNKRLRSAEPDSDYERRSSRQGSAKPADGYRRGAGGGNTRDEHTQSQRRYRSRSPRERSDRDHDRRRDRSRSGDRRDRERDRAKERVRERTLSRDRGHARRGYPSKSERYNRSRSPADRNRNARKRTRSRSPPPRGSKSDRRDGRADRTNGASSTKSKSQLHARVDSEDERDTHMKDESDSEVDPDDIEAVMRKTMGFTRFRSTQNTKVPGNNVYGVRKEKKVEYRQYMNRTGGFNRPLSPTR